MREPKAASGNLLVYAKVHDPEARTRVPQLLDDLPGERVSASLYEVFTEDWNDGSWDEELERMLELIDPAADTLIFWQAHDGKLVRTCIAGRFA
jgi:hypothetical protein